MANSLVFTFLLFTGACFVGCARGKGTIHPDLSAKFLPGIGGNGDDKHNVLVSFSLGLDTVFDRIKSMNFSSEGEKRNSLTTLEQALTETAQRALQSFLKLRGVDFESFWISNQMIIQNASPGLINAISHIPGVSSVEEEPVLHLDMPVVGEPEDANLTRKARNNWAEWGIQRIKADQVWQWHKGRGVVVANIDSGVRYTHEALHSNWRSDYGWYDPYRKSSSPNDQSGHGTHVMGTIAGQKGIGVAPRAKWIACKGCNGGRCETAKILACGQWIQCPTDTNGRNKDCSKAPKVVANSWGMNKGGLTFFDNVIKSWHAAGIIPVFSNGNSGPGCRKTLSPADSVQKVIAVGSIEYDNKISSFSSPGPANNGGLKPDISAPGGGIRSAWHTGDKAYQWQSGTSMACPHVAGVIALMLEKNRNLHFDRIWHTIISNADTDLDSSTARTCGNRASDHFPNNVFGYGRINALNSIHATKFG